MSLPHSTVAVITSTIGRPELVRTIESVKSQTYPCKHYIFVDGEQFADEVKKITAPYSDLIITYLPINTGKNGRANATIHAIAPFLVSEDVVCYLDDDNWYEPEHIENQIRVLNSGADFAYSLRNFYSPDGRFICPDDFESLGYWKMDEAVELDIKRHDKLLSTIRINARKEYLIDTNTYALSRELAQSLAESWYEGGYYGDRAVYNKLNELGLRGQSSGKYTVNYTIDVRKILNLRSKNDDLNQLLQKVHVKENILKNLCQINIARNGNKKPWAEE